MRPLYWIVFATFCSIVGAYPLVYLLADGKFGVLQTKSDALVANVWWRLGFYVHIVSGGVALSVGWSQFVKSWRNRCVKLHRVVGKLYVLMACVSGLAAVSISPLSSTGRIAGLGFGSLGVVWLCVTLQAYWSIRNRKVRLHECMMVYSYSACCAAVTLRLWLPLLLAVLRLDFAIAYPLVAWLCWVPNLLVAYLINARTLKQAQELTSSPPVTTSNDEA
ncbi:MAG: DUF2306 domain-containing protein [Planctomycetales bacterium]|nr:DUF2306 domain-containing protein [Planctomycetales bacterium]